MKKNKKNTAAPSGAPLSEQELEMLRASVQSEKVDRSKLPHYDNSDKAKFFRYVKKNKTFAAAAVVVLMCVALVLTLCVVFAVRHANENRVNKDDFTVFVGNEKYTVKYKDAVRGGVLYIDVLRISKYADLIRTGSDDKVKFTSSENNYLRFENDSDTAVINGSLVDLGGVAKVTGEVCEVPFEFLKKAIGTENGIKLSLDTETNTVKISRRYYETKDKDVLLPVEIAFYTDSFEILQSIKRPSADAVYKYPIDVSAYMSSIDPADKNAYLLLANKETPLEEDYRPSDLKKLECRTNRDMELRADAADALYAMMLAMSADGVTDIFVTSAYRSYSYQQTLFEGYVKDHIEAGMTPDEAKAEALTYSAEAGTSEHQTGLCLDFMTNTMTDLDETFEDTAAFRWLSENAYKYGFILRYPSDKTDITGYKYEPWHYRFVGRTVAAEIYNSGLCLEEYLELN